MKGHRSTFSLFPYTTLFRSPVGANRTTCITRDQILYAQQVGGPLPHHLAALAQKIAYRPLFFRIDVALRQNSQDRKSTRLNSSHSQISYAVICLQKKNLVFI